MTVSWPGFCASIKSPDGYGRSFTGEPMQQGLLVDLVLLVVPHDRIHHRYRS